MDKTKRCLVIEVEVGDLYLYSDEISDMYSLASLSLKGATYIDNGETPNDLLAFIELLSVIIKCHGPSLVGGEATIMLKRDMIVPTFEVVESLPINRGELHEFINVIPHALYEILREG